MAVTTYEGIVEKGKIRLKAGVKLPENAKVYVIVNDEVIPVTVDKKKPIQILSPHFIWREDAAHFELTVTKIGPKQQVKSTGSVVQKARGKGG